MAYSECCTNRSIVLNSKTCRWKKVQLLSSEFWDMSGNGHTLHILITPTRDTGNVFTSSLFTLRSLLSNFSGCEYILDYGDLKISDTIT